MVIRGGVAGDRGTGGEDGRYGWWDGGSSRTLTDVAVEPGTPGRPGGEAGAPGEAIVSTS